MHSCTTSDCAKAAKGWFFSRSLKRSLCCYLLLLLPSNPVFSQFVTNVSKVSTTAAAFLEIEAGSRAVGMGVPL